MKLDGNVVIMTGSGRGLGRASAIEMVKEWLFLARFTMLSPVKMQ